MYSLCFDQIDVGFPSCLEIHDPWRDIMATPYVPWRSQRTAYGTGIHLDQSVANAFRDHRATLLITLTDIHSLRLHSKGLVSREQLEHAQLPALTPNEKKVHLFDQCHWGQAQEQSWGCSHFKFLDILNSDLEFLYMFADSIWNSYLRRKCQINNFGGSTMKKLSYFNWKVESASICQTQ